MEDLSLFVPVSALLDYINCSICLVDLTRTTITTCGHRFCEACINEWVEKQSKCPCCNASLTCSQLIKDHQYDAFIAIILKEREKASKRYFDGLIENTNKDESMETNIGENDRPTIEKVFQKHLLPSLSAHKNYCETIQREYEAKLKSLVQEKDTLLEKLKESDNYLTLSQEDLDAQKAELELKDNEQQKISTHELNTCLDLVVKAYDRHLSKCIPPLDLLPIEVSVYILEKDIRITNVTLKPRDCGSVIWELIKRTMTERCDPIQTWGDDVRMVVFGPFAKSDRSKMRGIAKDVIENGNSNHSNVFVVKERSRLVLELGVRPNSEVVLYGNLVCRSDLPKQCYSQVTDDNKPNTVDYYTCNDCSVNWLCESCILVCHKNHQTMPYLRNHKPTWACCYCPKKKKCTLVK